MTEQYVRFENGDGAVWIYRFRVIRRTKAGAWLDVWGEEKFVLDGAGRRYAYPTEDAAWESFKIRKVRQRQHLEKQLEKLATIEPLTKMTWQDAIKRPEFELSGIDIWPTISK